MALGDKYHLTVDAYRSNLLTRIKLQFQTDSLAQPFVNILLVQGWSFGGQDYVNNDKLGTLQAAEGVEKRCMFHNVVLTSHNPDVRYKMSVD